MSVLIVFAVLLISGDKAVTENYVGECGGGGGTINRGRG